MSSRAQVVGRVVVEAVQVSEGTLLLAGPTRQWLVSVSEGGERVERTRKYFKSCPSHLRLILLLAEFNNSTLSLSLSLSWFNNIANFVKYYPVEVCTRGGLRDGN